MLFRSAPTAEGAAHLRVVFDGFIRASVRRTRFSYSVLVNNPAERPAAIRELNAAGFRSAGGAELATADFGGGRQVFAYDFRAN